METYDSHDAAVKKPWDDFAKKSKECVPIYCATDELDAAAEVKRSRFWRLYGAGVVGPRFSREGKVVFFYWQTY